MSHAPRTIPPLTPELAEKLIDCRRRGYNAAAAAAECGIETRILQTWLHRGNPDDASAIGQFRLAWRDNYRAFLHDKNSVIR